MRVVSLLLLLILLPSCSNRSPLKLSQVLDRYDFAYEITRQDGTGIVQVFRDSEAQYIQIVQSATAIDNIVIEGVGGEVIQFKEGGYTFNYSTSYTGVNPT